MITRAPFRFSVAFVLLAPLVVACSSGSTEDTASTTAQPLVAACAGKFTCTGGDKPIKPALTKTSAGCDVGGIHLTPDGNASDDSGGHYTWSGDTADFKVCLDGQCLDCKNDVALAPAPPPAASPSSSGGGKCTGSAYSCDGLGAGYCSSQSGCYGHEHVKWNGDLEWECAGVEDSCSSMPGPKSCANQRGCTWQP